MVRITLRSPSRPREARRFGDRRSAMASALGGLLALTTAWALTPVATGIAAEVTGHVANPFVGADGYLNPDYVKRVTAEATKVGGTVGASMSKVASFPTAVWLDRIAAVAGGPGVTMTLAQHLDAAVAQQKASGKQVVATFVVYDLPNRDCAALASNGELLVAKDGMARYQKEYIDPIAATLGDPKYADLRIVAIVEPDSLPNLVTNLSFPACAEANTSGAYVKGVQYALDELHPIKNVYTYVDIAHSGWLGWETNFGPTIDLITTTVKGTAAGLSSVDGFVSNTANYTPLAEPFLERADDVVGGQAVKSAPFYEHNPYLGERPFASAMRDGFIKAGFGADIGMLVDTSRNGWGGADRPKAASTATTLAEFVDGSRVDRRLHRGNWCNQPGGIGERPTAAPAEGFDAYVWIKPPGESDGTSDSSQTSADAEGKRFDAMCDPAGMSRYEPTIKTGALAGAPAAGQWFPEQFAVLVQNANPAL